MRLESVTLTGISPVTKRRNFLEDIPAVIEENHISLRVTKRDLEHRHFHLVEGSIITVNPSEVYLVLDLFFENTRPKYANCLCKRIA